VAPRVCCCCEGARGLILERVGPACSTRLEFEVGYLFPGACRGTIRDAFFGGTAGVLLLRVGARVHPRKSWPCVLHSLRHIVTATHARSKSGVISRCCQSRALGLLCDARCWFVLVGVVACLSLCRAVVLCLVLGFVPCEVGLPCCAALGWR
jgi:hypothetical protein